MKPHLIKRDRPLVLFSITTGWGIRNFVHTGLFDLVSEFADIGVATSKELLPFFRNMQERRKIALTVVLPSQESLLWRKVRQAKKAFLHARFDISTARIKWYQNGRGPLGKAVRIASWSIQRLLAAGWQIRALELLEFKFASRDLPQLVERPSVMINCSPFDFRDNQLQRSLHRKGIPTVAIIPSWDNPSTKGCISTCADLVLTWGDHQKHELLNFYFGHVPARVRVSGIPQFDAYYHELSDEFSRKAFLERLSISPDRRIILYATCSERLFPSEPEVVADLARAIALGRFGADSHLLIRCHPADRAHRYEHLCSTGRVTISPSSLSDSHGLGSWIPPEDEIDILAATIKHCEVCINTASTMTLDALACGKPVVNVAYDGEKEPPYLQSVRRYYDYHHYLPIARSGAVSIARTSEELFKSIDEALAKPEELQSRRDAVIKNICHHPAGGSVQFIVGEIERLL